MGSDPSLKIAVHGDRLRRKARSDASLSTVLTAYEAWRQASLAIGQRTREGVHGLVKALNEYKDVAEPIFDSRPDSGQEVLQSSILEEFLGYLFCGVGEVAGASVVRRPAQGYLDLVFHPKDIQSLTRAPEYTIRRKDHDFVIGGELSLAMQVEGGKKASESIVIPAAALECKRYLERNMLDECSGTADRIKRATPYCLYIVVAEYLKMEDCRPELSKVDEIYILRHQKNSERIAPGFVPNPIDGELVWDLYQLVDRHLRRIWWDPESALTTGKLFNR